MPSDLSFLLLARAPLGSLGVMLLGKESLLRVVGSPEEGPDLSLGVWRPFGETSSEVPSGLPCLSTLGQLAPVTAFFICLSCAARNPSYCVPHPHSWPQSAPLQSNLWGPPRCHLLSSLLSIPSFSPSCNSPGSQTLLASVIAEKTELTVAKVWYCESLLASE